MFIDLPQDYYYLNTSISFATIFNKICDLIQIHYEMAEYKRKILSKWNLITFQYIIKMNEEKLISREIPSALNEQLLSFIIYTKC